MYLAEAHFNVKEEQCIFIGSLPNPQKHPSFTSLTDKECGGEVWVWVCACARVRAGVHLYMCEFTLLIWDMEDGIILLRVAMSWMEKADQTTAPASTV